VPDYSQLHPRVLGTRECAARTILKKWPPSGCHLLEAGPFSSATGDKHWDYLHPA